MSLLPQSAEGVGFEPTRRVVTRPTVFKTVSGTAHNQQFLRMLVGSGALLRHRLQGLSRIRVLRPVQLQGGSAALAQAVVVGVAS